MKIIENIDRFIVQRFYLNYDQASVSDTLKDVQEGIGFKWTNMWILIMAIIICSVGLNMNSTAVVIWAMLLSPLMWPIIGLWVGMVRYDIDMVLKSARSLWLAAWVSVLIATCYFILSPLDSPTSEIIARTSPTVWDVIIALCGWVAGIVALTRKDKSLTVIPGVAIATALMPPLCTAGFGIANGMWMFALRAMYLFCINGVFIAGATYMMSRFIYFPKKNYTDTDSSTPSKVKRYLGLIMLAMIVPSVLGGADIVQQSITEKNINRYLSQEVIAQWWQIINQHINYDDKKIALWVTWSWNTSDLIESLEWKMQSYQLWEFALSVNQWLPSQMDINNQIVTVDQLAQSLQSTKKIIEQQQQSISQLQKLTQQSPALPVPVWVLYEEMNAIYPQIIDVGASIILSSRMTRDGVVSETGKIDILWSWEVNYTGLQVFDSLVPTWQSSIQLPRYIISVVYSWDIITPWQQLAILQRLQIRVKWAIIQQVLWSQQ